MAKIVGDHDLHPYPPGIPSDTFQRAIAIFTGSPIVPEDAHYLWHIAGYAISQFDTHPMVFRSAAPAFTSKEEAAKALTAAFPDGKIEGGVRSADPKGFNWLALLPILMTLLQELFKK